MSPFPPAGRHPAAGPDSGTSTRLCADVDSGKWFSADRPARATDRRDGKSVEPKGAAG